MVDWSKYTSFEWAVMVAMAYIGVDIVLSILLGRCVLPPKCNACKQHGHHH